VLAEPTGINPPKQQWHLDKVFVPKASELVEDECSFFCTSTSLIVSLYQLTEEVVAVGALDYGPGRNRFCGLWISSESTGIGKSKTETWRVCHLWSKMLSEKALQTHSNN
jgi:hypothetical protein